MDRYNFYDILEVHPHSTSHEITTAYEKLKVTYSGEDPAVYSIFTDQEVREYLKLIEEAYNTLSNKSLRSLYDERLGKKPSDSNKAEKKSTARLHSVDETFEREFAECIDWDGPQLKKLREYRNMEFDQLSQITKISSFYLQALESMNVRNLPATVFVRGYIVQLSRVLGVNEKVVADSYMKKFKTTLSEKSA